MRPLACGTLCGDEGDAELLQSATELSGLALAGELFVDGPVLVVASEDAAAIAVEGDGDAVAAQQALQQAEIALGSFRGEELGGQDFAGGVVLHAQSGEQGAATFEPVVRGAVELDEFAFTGRAQTALAMSGRRGACVASRGLPDGADGARFHGSERSPLVRRACRAGDGR